MAEEKTPLKWQFKLKQDSKLKTAPFSAPLTNLLNQT